jgi:hypothetical protein
MSLSAMSLRDVAASCFRPGGETTKRQFHLSWMRRALQVGVREPRLATDCSVGGMSKLSASAGRAGSEWADC